MASRRQRSRYHMSLAAILAAFAVDTVEREANRLNRFVSNLLDMVRVEAGALRLNIEIIDLMDAVAGAVHDAKRILEGCRIQLEAPPPPAAGFGRSHRNTHAAGAGRDKD